MQILTRNFKMQFQYPLRINLEQSRFLQPYVIEGDIDINKYNFDLPCWQAEGYDWTEGYGRKQDEK